MGDKYLRDFYYWPGPGSIIVDIDTHRPSNPKSRYSESLVAFRYTDPLQLSHISKHTRRVERIKRKNSRRKNRFITTVNYFVRNCQTGKCMGTPFSARGVLIILWVVSPLLNSLCYFFGEPQLHTGKASKHRIGIGIKMFSNQILFQNTNRWFFWADFYFYIYTEVKYTLAKTDTWSKD